MRFNCGINKKNEFQPFTIKADDVKQWAQLTYLLWLVEESEAAERKSDEY